MTHQVKRRLMIDHGRVVYNASVAITSSRRIMGMTPGMIAPLKGRFLPVFYPVSGFISPDIGSRQEMVFSPVSRRALRSVIARWIMASERAGRVL